MWAIPCYIGEGEGIRIETTRENALHFGAAIALTVECKVSLITDPPVVVFARRHGNPIAVQVDIDHERKWYTVTLPYTVLKDTGRWLPFTVDGTKWRLAAQRALNYTGAVSTNASPAWVSMGLWWAMMQHFAEASRYGDERDAG